MNYEEKQKADEELFARYQEDLLLMEKLKAELEQEDEEEQQYEFVPMSDEEMEALSDEEIDARIEILKAQRESDEHRRELDQKAVKMGMLRVAAEKAPRCSHLKSNGQQCKAPAMGNRPFCVFHTRAVDTDGAAAIRVRLLEDRESLQITVKEIMEKILSGEVQPQRAALLLRAVQIANQTLRRELQEETRRKPAGQAGSRSPDNPEEIVG